VIASCREHSLRIFRTCGSGLHSKRPSTHRASRVPSSLRLPDLGASTLRIPCHSTPAVAKRRHLIENLSNDNVKIPKKLASVVTSHCWCVEHGNDMYKDLSNDNVKIPKKISVCGHFTLLVCRAWQ